MGKDNPNYGNHKLEGKNNPRAGAVICVNTGEIFDTAKEASMIYNASHIAMCCKGKRKSSGKHPETGEPLVWEYYTK